MSASVPLLELQNIGKYFGNVKALENVSTTVNAGEVTCVLGDNGAGKSTFIKIISGLHKPSTGKYLFEGHEVSFESPREARSLGIAHCLSRLGNGAFDVGMEKLLFRF